MYIENAHVESGGERQMRKQNCRFVLSKSNYSFALKKRKSAFAPWHRKYDKIVIELELHS